MERKLQLIEDDMQKLSAMNQTLFDSWQDNMSEHFSKGCLNEMEHQWKQFADTITPLIQQLSRVEKEMQEYLQNCKQR